MSRPQAAERHGRSTSAVAGVGLLLALTLAALLQLSATANAGDAEAATANLTELAQHAGLIVIGEVDGPAPRPLVQSGGSLAQASFVWVHATRVVAGKPVERLRVQVPKGEEAAYGTGRQVLLFLQAKQDEAADPGGAPVHDHDGYFVHLGHRGGTAAPLHIEQGVVTLPAELADPCYAGVMPAPLTMAGLAEVLLLMRGPLLTFSVMEADPSCDRPLHLDIAFTNPSALPLPLQADSDSPDAADGLDFDTIDGNGFLTISQPIYIPFGRGLPPWWLTQGKHTITVIPPGGTVHRHVVVTLDAVDFRIDPAATRDAWLRFSPRHNSSTIADGWNGLVSVRRPLRLACPFPVWAATLAATAPGLLAQLSPRNAGTTSWRKAPLVAVELHVPAVSGAYEMQDPEDEERPFSDSERDALIAAVAVERDGAVVRAPVRSPALNRLIADIATHVCLPRRAVLDLAAGLDCSAPGIYRLRLVLDQGGTILRSNQLVFTVPKALPGAAVKP